MLNLFLVGASGVTPKRSLRPLLVEHAGSISPSVDEHQFALCCRPSTSDESKEEVWFTVQIDVFNLPIEYIKTSVSSALKLFPRVIKTTVFRALPWLVNWSPEW